jgi:hypothetical protein
MTGNIIFAYTRAQAIADGVLVDVTETAKEAGFKVSVVLTDTVHAEYVQVPAGVDDQTSRETLGHPLDVLSGGEAAEGELNHLLLGPR